MKFSLKDYLPLIYIYLLTTFLTFSLSFFFKLTIKDLVLIFLGIFSLIFGLLKLIRLNDFVEAFSEYDFVTQKIKFYGYAFPFFELSFGIFFLLGIDSLNMEITCLVLFTLNLISVLNALTKKRKFVCACLGDLIKVPLSYVSLFENITMLVGTFYLIIY